MDFKEAENVIKTRLLLIILEEKIFCLMSDICAERGYPNKAFSKLREVVGERTKDICEKIAHEIHETYTGGNE